MGEAAGAQLLLRLLLLLLACRHVCSQCRISLCSSQYEAAMEKLPGPRKGGASCRALHAYSTCIRRTAHTCRGNLAYHTAAYVVDNLIRKNCSRADLPPTPPPHAETPQQQDVESLEPCGYEKQGQPPTFQHCAALGGPHLRTFSGELHTCRLEGSWPLLDNRYLFVQATSSPLGRGSGATAVRKLTIIFKDVEECVGEKVYQAEVDALPAAFVDGHVTGGEGPGGSSLTLRERTPGRHVEIRAAYISTAIVVRQAGRQLSFSIRAPAEVATSFTEEQDLQLCVWGCPPSQRVPQSEGGSDITRLLCEEKLPAEDAYLQACDFDTAASGDGNFSLAAPQALEDAQRSPPGSGKLPLFQAGAASPFLSSSLLLCLLLASAASVLQLRF